jgi:hypothetical protein
VHVNPIWVGSVLAARKVGCWDEEEQVSRMNALLEVREGKPFVWCLER